jgi:hypothetical protein
MDADQAAIEALRRRRRSRGGNVDAAQIAEACNVPMKGLYGADSTCARPKHHTGEHGSIWFASDWEGEAMISDQTVAEALPCWCAAGEFHHHEHGCPGSFRDAVAKLLADRDAEAKGREQAWIDRCDTLTDRVADLEAALRAVDQWERSTFGLVNDFTELRRIVRPVLAAGKETTDGQ